MPSTKSGISSDHLFVTNKLEELSINDFPSFVTSSTDSGGTEEFSVVVIYSTLVEVIVTSSPLIFDQV